MATLSVKNWTKYQGYTKRGPAWVKLYASLLNDPGWISLPVESRALLPALWLVASGQSTAGSLPADVRVLAILTHVAETEIQGGLPALISFGFLQCDGCVAGLATVVSGEKRREEESRDREETEQSAAEPRLASSRADATRELSKAGADVEAMASSKGRNPDREEYVREVWAAWCEKRGGELPIASPAEHDLARALFEDGVPLRIALRGIADCSKPPRGPRTPLTYAHGAFNDAARMWRRGMSA
jgi:hypothetical protein